MIRLFHFLFAVLLSAQLLSAGEPRTLTCDFDGENATRVYKVVTAVGVGTTFRLPEGLKINDFVVTDPKGFHAESNGTIGIVTPLVPNKSTSVSIFTDNEKLFVFYLSSEPSESVDQLVIIQSSNLQFFKDKVRSRGAKAGQGACGSRPSAVAIRLRPKRQTGEGTDAVLTEQQLRHQRRALQDH